MDEKKKRKTSVYFSEDDSETLRGLSEQMQVSQAKVLQEALAAYYVEQSPDRDFAFAATFDGDGTSIADIPENELMKGFGE